MPKQLTTKRKAEGPHYGQNAMPTKKLQKASSRPALNNPPHPASATDSSLSENPSPPRLTSGSSIEDSWSSTANSLVDKSSASTAAIEKSSSAPSTTGACSTSMLQETRPNHGDAQEIKEITWQELDTMSREQLLAYGRSRGWKCPSRRLRASSITPTLRHFSHWNSLGD
jgi:hypothetical protein